MFGFQDGLRRQNHLKGVVIELKSPQEASRFWRSVAGFEFKAFRIAKGFGLNGLAVHGWLLVNQNTTDPKTAGTFCEFGPLSGHGRFVPTSCAYHISLIEEAWKVHEKRTHARPLQGRQIGTIRLSAFGFRT